MRFMVARHVGLLQVQTRGEGVVLGLAMDGSSAARGIVSSRREDRGNGGEVLPGSITTSTLN